MNLGKSLRKGSNMIRWYFCEDITYGNACVQTVIHVQSTHMHDQVEHVSCRCTQPWARHPDGNKTQSLIPTEVQNLVGEVRGIHIQNKYLRMSKAVLTGP